MKLIPIQDIEAQRAEGIHWKSAGAARWCERTAQQNGLSDAFIRVGRRVFVDPDKFHELARAKSKSAQAAGAAA